jgi:hypothetical protein
MKELMEELKWVFTSIFINSTEIFPSEKAIFLNGIRTFAANKKCNLKHKDEQRRWEHIFIAAVG